MELLVIFLWFLYLSQAVSQVCKFDEWPRTNLRASVAGDVTLGVIIRVHEKSDQYTCGAISTHGGVEVVEAILHTVDIVNSDPNFLKGYSLGVIITDDCGSDSIGVDQAVGFIKGSSSIADGSCYTGGNDPNGGAQVVGVIGGTTSATSIQIASLLKLFKKPQISHSSTSPELSNRERYPYFLRTLPSDTIQAMAIVELFKQFGWTYVSTVIDSSYYGSQSVGELERLLREADICTAVTVELRGKSSPDDFVQIVEDLGSVPRAKGVILLGSPKDVAKLMEAVAKTNSTGKFVWISGETWGGHVLSETLAEEMEGAIVIHPLATSFARFTEWFNEKHPSTNKINPWFAEYWEQTFKCRYHSEEKDTPFNCHYKTNCTGHEKLTMSDALQNQEPQMVQAHSAVMAYAKTIQEIHKDKCGKDAKGMCKEFTASINNGTEVLEYLKKTRYYDLRKRKPAGWMKSYFEDNGDGPARYRIANFQQVSKGKFEWISVGSYDNAALKVEREKIKFRMDDKKLPESICSKPCGKGQARSALGNKCCWNCVNCTAFQILAPGGDRCLECPNGTLPSRSGAECVEIPYEYLRYTDGFVIGALLCASIGVCVTIFVIIVFIMYRETAIVRASGRELSFVLLAGILLCYLMTFVLTAKPSDISCGFQKAGIGLCYTICYAALLTKTSRIARIFKSGKSSAKRPKFISPSSQLIICGALVLVELLVDALWLMENTPKAVPFYPTRMEHHLVCESLKGMEYMIGFAYPMLLIIICTIYAILTRKIPEGFNESKYIGFTMYTTCIIWLAFVPIYVTTAKNIQLRVITMCFSVSLSATVSLLCLFAPKLYIVLLRPERNVRTSLMNSTRKAMMPPMTSITKMESSFTEEMVELKNHKPKKSSSSLSSDAGICMSTQTPEMKPSLKTTGVQTVDVMSRLRDKYPHLSEKYYNH